MSGDRAFDQREARLLQQRSTYMSGEGPGLRDPVAHPGPLKGIAALMPKPGSPAASRGLIQPPGQPHMETAPHPTLGVNLPVQHDHVKAPAPPPAKKVKPPKKKKLPNLGTIGPRRV
jgi:hypothetical protein